MKLVIFDIDGTLTQTNRVDSGCFVEVVKEVLGVEDFETDWSQYQYVTDRGGLLRKFPIDTATDPSAAPR